MSIAAIDAVESYDVEDVPDVIISSTSGPLMQRVFLDLINSDQLAHPLSRIRLLLSTLSCINSENEGGHCCSRSSLVLILIMYQCKRELRNC